MTRMLRFADEAQMRAPKPLKLKPVRVKEGQYQSGVIDWWRFYAAATKLPEKALMSIPNGTKLYGDQRQRVIQAMFLKRTGMRKGAPDLLLAIARGEYHGLFIEMKADGGEVSPDQRDMITMLKDQGYSVSVAYTADSAISTIKAYCEEWT